MAKGETFGELLKRLRTENDLTLRELAEKLGVKHSYLSQLETGMAEMPSEDLARKVAKEFNQDEEKIVFLARKIPEQIQKIKEKYPKVAPSYFRKILKKKEDEK